MLALLGLAGSAAAALVAGWLAPVLIVASVLLLGRSFHILYIQRRGTYASAVITWLAAAFVIGFWAWRLYD